MFKPVPPQLNVTLLEDDMLRFWRLYRIFARCNQLRQDAPEFVYYERPPNASAKPSLHDAMARAFKDIFLRYKQMRGYRVLRRGGWDTHGLPAEIHVERQLGFNNKSQIEAYGVARFNQLCRQSAFETIKEWERFNDRIAYWVDMQEAYVTYTNEYIESLWWMLKTFWERNLLYQGYKIVPYCPRCGTPLSDHEAAQGYREVEGHSIYVRFPLVDEPGASLLVWTSAPWTLPGNAAVAAHPEVEYVTVRRGLLEGGSERLILARDRLEQVFGDEHVAIVDSFRGRKLKGRRYHPLFTFLHTDKPTHYVVMQDQVSVQQGSGLAHIAPAFGAEALQAALEFDLPILMTVAEDGTFVPEVRPWSGMFVKDADPYIVRDLDARGLLLRAARVVHTQPFCWRCNTPLLSYARSAWYLRTSQFKEQLARLNQEINWIPEHIWDGRLGEWLENNVDWALGRERYWGAPLPIWECEKCRHQLAVGSLEELSGLAGRDLSGLDLHRPHVDELLLPCPECGAASGGMMRRIPQVIDVRFDSGAMPAAQWHFPFENRETFRQQYPADFICESVDQARSWFYALHAISALLFDSPAFKNAICLGAMLDSEGEKMSRSSGDRVDPWPALDAHGADACRWYLYIAAPPGQELRFSADLVDEAARNFTLPLWNVYAFFVAHANLDHWLPPIQEGIEAYNDLDRWLRSELHALVRDVTEALERYDAPGATRPIQAFVENLSKWYLRNSRRRFWEGAPQDGQKDPDKESAYAVLFEALVTLSKLLAPSMPFLAEALHQNLARSVDAGAPISVHLCDWPQFDPRAIDPALNEEMRLVQKLASLGHAARKQAGIKVRQPLSEAAFCTGRDDEAQLIAQYTELLAGELNVKQVRALGATGEALRIGVQVRDLEGLPEGGKVQAEAHSGLAVACEAATLAALKTELTPDLLREGLAREFAHRVQELRKGAEIGIAERVRLYLQATPDLLLAVQAQRDYVMGEALALELVEGQAPEGAAQAEAWFDGQWMKVGIMPTE
ncbi:MAG: isoleucine--tRNA ligase [Anaerolineales bacterium]|nr:isoleucine--tRNA ligase [Anaerolineales bacterium]